MDVFIAACSEIFAPEPVLTCMVAEETEAGSVGRFPCAVGVCSLRNILPQSFEIASVCATALCTSGSNNRKGGGQRIPRAAQYMPSCGLADRFGCA